jgi:hypothetical protein
VESEKKPGLSGTGLWVAVSHTQNAGGLAGQRISGYDSQRTFLTTMRIFNKLK